MISNVAVERKSNFTHKQVEKTELLLFVVMVLFLVVLSECHVEVEEGEDSVQLPFKSTGDLPEDGTVEWETSEPEYMRVHVYQDGSDQPQEQDNVYRGRTEMNKEPLKSGNLSISLKNPTPRDTGTYVCEVYSSKRNILRKKTVQLKVKGWCLYLFACFVVWFPSF